MARIALVNLASMPMPGNEPIFPIGSRCLQAALEQAGHETLLVDFVENPKDFEDLSWVSREWDVIGFSIRNIDPIDLAREGFVRYYQQFIERIRTAAGPQPPVMVAGGPGYSLFGSALLKRLQLDAGVVGPGESAILEIAADPEKYRGSGENLKGGRYEGFLTERLSHPTSLLQAYASLPAAMIGIETKRKTCYQECVYCPYAHISGDNLGDLKPISLIEHEIRGIYEAGVRRIFFTDAIFNSEIRFAKQVVSLLADLKLPGLTWTGYFAPRPFDDEFAELVSRSNVESVLISPDSLDVAMMGRLGKRFDTRHVTRFIERCRAHELKTRVNLVFGGPGETEETVRASAEYVNEHLRTGEPVLNIGFRVLPATALARQVGIPDDDLVEPTFYPLNPELFGWVIKYFDGQFLPNERLLHIMIGNIASKKMTKVPYPEGSAGIAPTGFPYLALTRGPSDV
ncbi:B12-binding domain-containing radical SAM protein [Actinacidiphila sp. bgisy145]|uniref:B12-binding domain-containing radical SAM protein n=1 Tax=Actinacidiphila sp. bgisy145 TaxID=3413792 RepID=UPI003EBF7623